MMSLGEENLSNELSKSPNELLHHRRNLTLLAFAPSSTLDGAADGRLEERLLSLIWFVQLHYVS